MTISLAANRVLVSHWGHTQLDWSKRSRARLFILHNQ